MATSTPIVGLSKPDYSDPADVTVLNSNFDKIDTAIGQRSRVENLLHNSDFRAHMVINQRGWKSGNAVAAGEHFIDRWTIEGGDSPTLDADGISASTGVITQKVARNGLVGKTVTAAVGLSDGTIIAKSGVVPEWSAWDNFINTSANGVGLMLTSASLSLLRFRITPNGNTVLWAALYEGEYTAANLPAYQPKGYLAELQDCRRIYRKYTNLAITGGSHNATTFVCALDMHDMRVTPSVVAFSCSWLKVGGTNITSGVTAAVGSFYRINLTTETNMTTNHGGVAYVGNLELSADW